jgi:putative flippase GtrA
MPDESNSLKTRLPVRAASFTSPAAAGMAVQYALLIVFSEAFMMPPISASILGFLAGAATHCRLMHHQEPRYSENVPEFVAMAWMGLMLNASVMCVLAIIADMHYLTAQFAATAVVLLCRFLGNPFRTFADETGNI